MWRRLWTSAGGTLDQNMHLNRLNAMLGAVALNMIHPFMSILAIKLGASNQQLGSLSSLPNLLSIPAVLMGGWLLSRRQRKKGAVAAAFLIARLLWLLVAAVPWVPEGARVTALIGAWALALAPHNAGGIGMSALVADLFPGEQRARVLAARHAAGTGAGVVAGLLAGLLLDRLPYPYGYQLMFTGAVLVGLAEVAVLWRMQEGTGAAAAFPGGPPTPVGGAGGVTARLDWLQALRFPPFLRFTAASVVFHFSWQLVWPLFSRYQVTELGATNTWISVLNVVNASTAVVSSPRWAIAAERYGPRRMLVLAAFMLALMPGLTAVAPNLYWLIPANLLGGVATSGVIVLVLNILLEVAPAERRPVFMAVNSALVAGSAAVAPLVGGALMDVLPVRTALFVGTALRLLLGVGSWIVLDRVERFRQEKERCGGNL